MSDGPATSRVSAVAALRSESGKSRLEPGAEVTTESVAGYHAAPETVEAVARALSEMGFTVTGKGPLAVSFSGPRELFEGTFRAPSADEAAPRAIPERLLPHVERVTLAKEVRFFPTR